MEEVELEGSLGNTTVSLESSMAAKVCGGLRSKKYKSDQRYHCPLSFPFSTLKLRGYSDFFPKTFNLIM